MTVRKNNGQYLPLLLLLTAWDNRAWSSLVWPDRSLGHTKTKLEECTLDPHPSVYFHWLWHYSCDKLYPVFSINASSASWRNGCIDAALQALGFLDIIKNWLHQDPLYLHGKYQFFHFTVSIQNWMMGRPGNRAIYLRTCWSPLHNFLTVRVKNVYQFVFHSHWMVFKNFT